MDKRKFLKISCVCVSIFLIQLQCPIFVNSSTIRQDNGELDKHGPHADRFNIMLVVGNSDELNRSEQQVQERLESNGYHVCIIDDTFEKDEPTQGKRI
jgi:hypothetical protein